MVYRRLGLMKKRNSQSNVIPKKMKPMTAIATMLRAVSFHSNGDFMLSYMPFTRTHTVNMQSVALSLTAEIECVCCTIVSHQHSSL